jgi:hypothetical protein
MKSFVLAGLTLSILLILSLGGVAQTEKVGMTKNMTTPMNMTAPMMNMKMPMSMPMDMPNKMANGSMNMIMLQNVTLNFVLIQNLTEVMNMPTNINAPNGNKTNAFDAIKHM